MHVPKTGGSYLEELAAANGVPWGVCHFGHKFAKFCRPFLRRAYRTGQPRRVNPWHLPPRYFPAGVANPYVGDAPAREGHDGAANATNHVDVDVDVVIVDRLVVVRHPYDRAVSQWKYMHGGDDDDPIANNATAMNAALRERVGEMLEGGTKFFDDDAHFVPQCEYLAPVPAAVPVVDGGAASSSSSSEAASTSSASGMLHVLRTESLSNDLPYLLRRYNLNWNVTTTGDSRVMAGRGNLTAADLDDETRELISRAYACDFDLLASFETAGDEAGADAAPVVMLWNYTPPAAAVAAAYPARVAAPVSVGEWVDGR